MVWKVLLNPSTLVQLYNTSRALAYSILYVSVVVLVFADRRRTELIPEEINRQHVQTLQDSLLPDIQKNLEDFR